MSLKPGSEPTGIGEPEDYQADHPEEHPSQWGWHGEWGRSAGVGGLVVAALLLLMLTATNYEIAWTITLILTAILLVVLVFLDRHRRRTSWRR